MRDDTPDAPNSAAAAADAALRLKAVMAGHLAQRDRAAAVMAAIRGVESGTLTIPQLYTRVLTPLLHDIGTSWQVGETAVWQEHYASAAVRTVIEALNPHVTRTRPALTDDARTVVLACPPEETHDLGLRMLADRFELAGWRVIYVGADTPEADLHGAIRDTHADAAVLSVSTHFHRLRLREIVERLHAEFPKLTVWVGGAAFAFDHECWADDELLNPAALFADEGWD